MKIINNILALAFCIAVSLTNSFAQTDDLRAAWQVTKYDISANLSQTDRSLTSTAVLSLKNVGKGVGTSLTLRISKNATVSMVKINGNEAVSTKAEDRLPQFQLIRLRFPNVAANSEVSVSVDYKIAVTENSGVNSISPLGSQFVPILSTNVDTAPLTLWYPTVSSPFNPKGADFAPFKLSVSGASSGETVVSSGKATGNSFEQSLNSQPLFIVGDFEKVEGANTTAYLPKGFGADEKKRAEELLELANAAKMFASSSLRVSFDTPIRIVAVRKGAGFSDSGTILLDYAAFRRQKIDAATAMSVSESIVRTFLGNVIPVRGEANGVIREGLSRYIATQFIEKQFGKEAAENERLRQRLAYATVAKRDLPLGLTTLLDDTFFGSVPNKSAIIWRLVAKTIGENELFAALRSPTVVQNGLTLANLRAALSQNVEVKEILNYGFDQVTDADLLVGLPQVGTNETKAALRNLGSLNANVNVVATTDKGEKLSINTVIPARDFGTALFKTPAKIVRIEVDPEKFYPQLDYSNDIAPHETAESDASAEIAKKFVRQEFTRAEEVARKYLQFLPRNDEVRTWLGRLLLAQDKLNEAENEFKTVIGEKLPTAKSLAWANQGLGEIALKRNQNAVALKSFVESVKADGEYASTLSGHKQILKIEPSQPIDKSIEVFFMQLDKAILTTRKTEVENFVIPGESSKFANGVVVGQPEQWQTKALRVEQVGANYVNVDVSLNLKRLGKEPESGTAVYVLGKAGNSWKVVAVEFLEVR